MLRDLVEEMWHKIIYGRVLADFIDCKTTTAAGNFLRKERLCDVRGAQSRAALKFVEEILVRKVAGNK